MCGGKIFDGCEPNAAQQVAESRVSTQPVEHRFDLPFEELYRVLFKSAVEPFKGLIFFSEPRVNEGHVVRRDGALLRFFLQVAEQLQRVFLLACGGVSESEERYC